MRFVARGHIAAAVHFSNQTEICVALCGGSVLRLQTVQDERGYPFVLEQDAGSLAEAEAGAQQGLEMVTDSIAFFFRAPVYESQIDEVTDPVGGITTRQQTLSMNTRIAAVASTERAIEFAQCLPKIAAEPSSSKLRTAARLFRDALASPDRVRRFWNLYNLLQMLVGERKDIDKRLKERRKHGYKFPLLKNDHDSQERTKKAAKRGKPPVTGHPDGVYLHPRCFQPR